MHFEEGGKGRPRIVAFMFDVVRNQQRKLQELAGVGSPKEVNA